jgi:hypothetical protein
MIVDSGLQLRLVSISLGYLVFYVAALAAALFVPLMFQLNAADLNSAEARELAISVLYLHKHFWPVSLLSLAVITLHSILTTHRVAGPLYRFRQIIDSIQGGTIPRPGRLRRRDFLQPEMKLINEMLESLRQRVVEIQTVQATMAESVSDCRRRAEFLADAEMTRCIDDLAIRGDRLAKSVRLFQIPE